jgi:hypothetical protein
MNLIDEISRQAALLSRENQMQVLDFVEYLVKKYTADAPTEDEAWDQVSGLGKMSAGAPPTDSR